MRSIQEYDQVKVVRLLTLDRPYEGTEPLTRPPAVGDIASVCHEYERNDPTARVAVEMVDADGNTIWFADFEREELELVYRPEPPKRA
jgi:hypothetical protein